jgi:ribosomal protein S18 acetylase RimI-like enzyme
MANKKVIIRKATKRNLKDILRMIREYQQYDVEFARRYYERFFSYKSDEMTEKDEVYIALLDEEPVGVIGYCRDYFSTDYSYWLGWFIVRKKFRRNRIGTKLLRKVERDLKAMRKRKLFVSTEDNNKEAKNFYTANGFRTEGVVRDYYWNGEDQLIMSKTLL